MTPEDAAAHQVRQFFHLLARLPAAQATPYALQVLERRPIDVSVVRCDEAGGLRPQDWMPMGHAVREAVMRVHDPKAWAALPGAANTLMLDNGATVTFGPATNEAWKSSVAEGPQVTGVHLAKALIEHAFSTPPPDNAVIL